MDEIYVKSVNSGYIPRELESISFDKTYISHAVRKNTFKTLKVFNLRPQEASILKQTALSLGFDAAVNRGVIDCSVKFSDALLTGSLIQFERLCERLSAQPFKMRMVASLISSEINVKPEPLTINAKTFDWRSPCIMGILNITPDSFSDGGKYVCIESAVEQFHKLCEEGADIVDIGAESTRPGHVPITPDEEIERLAEILKEIRLQNSSIPISIDTRNVKTAETALKLGANCINDVGFGEYDKNMIEFVNSNSIPYILMHAGDVTAKNSITDIVYADLAEKLEKLSTSVIVDIGIGFGKTVSQNFELLERIEEFKSLGRPLLVGHSRKSFLSKSLNLSADELDVATLAVSSGLLKSGVNILRVHDVKKHRIAVDIYSKLAPDSQPG